MQRLPRLEEGLHHRAILRKRLRLRPLTSAQHVTHVKVAASIIPFDHYANRRPNAGRADLVKDVRVAPERIDAILTVAARRGRLLRRLAVLFPPFRLLLCACHVCRTRGGDAEAAHLARGGATHKVAILPEHASAYHRE